VALFLPFREHSFVEVSVGVGVLAWAVGFGFVVGAFVGVAVGVGDLALAVWFAFVEHSYVNVAINSVI